MWISLGICEKKANFVVEYAIIPLFFSSIAVFSESMNTKVGQLGLRVTITPLLLKTKSRYCGVIALSLFDDKRRMDKPTFLLSFIRVL